MDVTSRGRGSDGSSDLLDHLKRRADAYLRHLCVDLPTRSVGSTGNQRATDFFARTVASFGFEAATPAFACMDWHEEGVRLEVEGASFLAAASPYSRPCRVTAPLAVVSTMKEMAMGHFSDFVVLLQGDIAQEPLMPKNVPFHRSVHDQKIIQLLELAAPQALVTATSRDATVTGTVRPVPLIEDGDFDIPSVYLTGPDSTRLARHAGAPVTLESRAARIASSGCNVIARRVGSSQRRIALVAHIDAQRGSPGALDDASGIVVLLLLAELLQAHAGYLTVELVAMNGEDYYSNPGEQQYLALNAGRFADIVLSINIDGAGYRLGGDAFSLYSVPEQLGRTVRNVFAQHDGLIEGPAWAQGDHRLFVMNDVPAVAITAERVTELVRDVIHTKHDRPEVVDTARLAALARTLRLLVMELDADAAAR